MPRRRTLCPRDFGAFHVFTFTEDNCSCGWTREGPPPEPKAAPKPKAAEKSRARS